MKVILNSKKYAIDYTKLENAVSNLENTLGKLSEPDTPTIPTDLTGYRVDVPSGWSCPSEFLKVNLYGNTYNTSWGKLNPATNDVPNLWFGWSWSWEQPFGVRSSSDVILYASDIPNSDVYTYKNSNSISWFITGGDTSNQTLIQWFVDNGATFTKVE